MKVKVRLSRLSMLEFNGGLSPQEAFIQSFDYVNVEALEPNCPFCGEHLKNAECKCQKYNEAYKKVCHEFSENLVFSKIDEENTRHAFIIKPSDLQMVETVSANINLSDFDNGSCAKTLFDTWFISTGEYRAGFLNFYVRKQGTDKIYLCEIKKQLEFAKHMKVILYEIKTDYKPRGYSCQRLGDYATINSEHTVATMMYEEFLTKLKRAT